ncbi:hypothetical protein GGR57DRAFT_120282 [Xylariaceae sp. FL1272]|nr:hypothetical protein GGR57DRAFT_120282 [Xylariaceae sp. FL1272]
MSASTALPSSELVFSIRIEFRVYTHELTTDSEYADHTKNEEIRYECVRQGTQDKLVETGVRGALFEGIRIARMALGFPRVTDSDTTTELRRWSVYCADDPPCEPKIPVDCPVPTVVRSPPFNYDDSRRPQVLDAFRTIYDYLDETAKEDIRNKRTALFSPVLLRIWQHTNPRTRYFPFIQAKNIARTTMWTRNLLEQPTTHLHPSQTENATRMKEIQRHLDGIRNRPHLVHFLSTRVPGHHIFDIPQREWWSLEEVMGSASAASKSSIRLHKLLSKYSSLMPSSPNNKIPLIRRQ